MSYSSLFLPKELNHKNLFFFGFVYYLVCPLIILQSDIFEGYPGIDLWKSNNKLQLPDMVLYIALISGLFISFYCGSCLGQKINIQRERQKKGFGKMSSSIAIIPIFLILIFFGYQSRNVAFRGYSDDMDLSGVGILSTLNLLLFYIHFVLEQPKKIKWAYGVLLILNSIFLLGLGGRLYVIMPAVSYFIRSYNKNVKEGNNILPYIVLLFIIASVASLLAAWRIGADADLFFYLIFAEPIFTSYSAFSYLHQNAIQLITFPYNFVVSFLNVIPSLLWPGKALVLANLLNGWAIYDAPLGALSIFVSIFGDFGVIGGGIFIFFIGAFFGQLYKSYKDNILNDNIYYIFCCVLPFSFFRDPISIPIKIFILSFGIIPFLLQILRMLVKKKTN